MSDQTEGLNPVVAALIGEWIKKQPAQSANRFEQANDSDAVWMYCGADRGDQTTFRLEVHWMGTKARVWAHTPQIDVRNADKFWFEKIDQYRDEALAAADRLQNFINNSYNPEVEA